MYINPFAAGVLCTILVEFLIVFVVAIYQSNNKKK